MAPTIDLDALFPSPAPPPSALCPQRLPGVSPESGIAVSELLKENHRRFHIFFNDKGFHNHISHHLLALYYLGGKGPLMRAALEEDTAMQREYYGSPGKIDEKNYHEHLGDEKYWEAYFEFFASELLEKGAAVTTEKWLFSPQANIEEPAPGKPAMQMLSRFLAGVLHPLIHVGYGAEFGLPGMFAEGLAMAAIQHPEVPTLVPNTLFQYVKAASSDAGQATVNLITSLMPALVLERLPGRTAGDRSATGGVHALTLMARVLNDPEFSPESIGLPPPKDAEEDALARVGRLRGDVLAKYADQWGVDGTSPEAVTSKIEELVWMNVILYGVGGWAGRGKSKAKTFNADFLLMHLVTSVLYMPSLAAYLSPTSIAILLRSYFINSLGWWVARGRPALPLRDFYAAVGHIPTAPDGTHVRPAEGALNRSETTPNAWLSLLQSTLMHPDDHVPKCQRTLAHYASLLGSTPQGTFAALAQDPDPRARLEGAECLDGTLFARVAGLTADRVGWMREGQENGGWDFVGFCG
ncbi:hypothetical protein CERSUDRAFT_124504 [Gelatoporia subvermispora B]|uniref:Questin oxidase n=1 Tax=Ceriporiopsis subvermispora (strain B) TaxID=914234 RepID=M2QV53_CERS8|nr:hypothetical protein CERSUDRAFT_124504 [Gelatoporia subvermispora B]